MQRKLIVVISIIGILGLSFALSKYFESQKVDPESNIKKNYKRYVKGIQVSYKTLPGTIETSGRMISNNEVVVTSSVSGWLKGNSNFFKSAQSFKAGELLARVEDEEFIYSHYARKSKFLQTIAGILPDIKIDIPDVFNKWNGFFESVKIKEPLPDLPSIQLPKERIYLASKSVLSDYYTLKSEEARLEKYKIIAPFNGTIKDVSQQIGAYVNTGTRIATISMTDSYEIEVPVSVSEIDFVKKGQDVEILNDKGEIWKKGIVSRISDVINSSTQSVSVFCRILDDGKGVLFDGKYNTVTIHGTPVEHAMSIPRNAVYNGDEVYIIDDGKAIKRKVKILKTNKNTAYFNGLEEGESLVTEPLMNLGDNSNFEIIN